MATTPRSPPPTMTGRPRRAGLSICSTDAKKASMSTCTIIGEGSPGAGYSALTKLMRSFLILGPSDSQR